MVIERTELDPGFKDCLFPVAVHDTPLREKILMEIERNPQRSVAELAGKFDVTEDWIRKIRRKIEKKIASY